MAEFKRKKRNLQNLRKKINELFLMGELTEGEAKDIETEATNAIDIDGDKPENEEVVKDITRTVMKKLTAARQQKTGPVLTLCMERLGGAYLSHPEIRDLVHYSVIGPVVQKPRWAYFRPWRSTSQTVVIRVNCSTEYIESNDYSFNFVDDFFSKKWIRMSSNMSERDQFWSHLFRVPVSLQEQIKEKIRLGRSLNSSNNKDRATLKEQLLITSSDMVDNSYPFPDGKYIATKEKYAPVTENSPLYALDCEMCITTAQMHELTRVSLIREDGTVLIDSLVKPANEITDYLTRFSGITKEMLEDVNTTLRDVQKAIQACLPPDAILCGHSLEFDLKAMGLAHPYCIDVALLYNLSGVARSKSSLKNLMSLFFNKDIQSKRGHCSVEDAMAAMDLINMKLEKGLVFGNLRYGWDYDEYVKTKKQTEGSGESEDSEDEDEIPHKRQKLNQPKKRFCACGSVVNIECILPNCQCLISPPSKCVKCLGADPLEPLENGFDWNASLRIDTSMKYRSLHYYLNESSKNVLIGFDPPVELSSHNTKLFDKRIKPSDMPISEFIQDLSLEVLNYGLAFFEMDYAKNIKEKPRNVTEGGEDEREEGELLSEPSSSPADPALVAEIDENIENIVRNSARSSLIILIFSSPTASICYLKVK